MVAGRVLVARFRNRLGDIDGVDSLRNQEAVCLGRVDLTWVADLQSAPASTSLLLPLSYSCS